MKTLAIILFALLSTQSLADNCNQLSAKNGSEIHFLKHSKIIGYNRPAFIVIDKYGAGTLHYIPSAGTENDSVKAINVVTDELISIDTSGDNFKLGNVLYRPTCK